MHAIGFSDRQELKGAYANTSRENFTKTMLISCFSFTETARRAAELMTDGGSMVTLTYGGSTRVMPNYNVMGVAKAALEASVRYLASDYGPQNIRVNAISAGPMRTLAGAGISDSRAMYNYQKRNAPLRRTVTLDEVGGAGLYLLSDLSGWALPARCISSIPVILRSRCRAWKRSTPPIRNSSRQAVLRG